MLRRVLLSQPPFPDTDILTALPWGPQAQWPCRWLTPPAPCPTPVVMAFRLVLDLAEPLATTIHVSADERYELWLDGSRAGSGPERGDENLWAYESYDLRLSPGRHVLMLRVWALGALAPWAQRSLGAGAILACDAPHVPLLGTGVAPWRVRRCSGFTFTPTATSIGCELGSGPGETCSPADGWWEAGDASPHDDWLIPLAGEPGNNGDHVQLLPRRLLVPASLPAQAETIWTNLQVRAADDGAAATVLGEAVDPVPWTALLAGRAMTVPPQARRRALISLGTYVCGRPELQISGGRGARVSIALAEGVVRSTPDGERKGRRDVITGARVRGVPEVLLGDGGTHAWRPLWWRSGQWMEVVVETADEALTINSLAFVTTGYPMPVTGGSIGTDAVTAAIHASCERTWRACAHETFMDCPYYEQLMYVGDTRVQALLTYVLTADDRLPRKSLQLFDAGRLVGRGLVPDAYPAYNSKLIPPFALWWIGMVHDHAWWRGGDLAARMMPGVRGVAEHFLARIGDDGLWISSPHWNYLDWYPQSRCGTPAGGESGGRNASFNWQLVQALDQLAGLEDLHCDPELAARARRRGDELTAAIRRTFWDEAAGCFSDDPSHGVFSEHAQVLAILSGRLTSLEQERTGAALTGRTDLCRTSCYFSHYLFEAFCRIGRPDLLLTRMGDWRDSLALGLTTTPEGFGGEGRSDCHAWSAHPLYHYLASLLGVRPASAGFASVRIAPCLGTMPTAAGTVAHPRGTIRVHLERQDGRLRADITLPEGLAGELLWHGHRLALRPGQQRLDV